MRYPSGNVASLMRTTVAVRSGSSAGCPPSRSARVVVEPTVLPRSTRSRAVFSRSGSARKRPMRRWLAGFGDRPVGRGLRPRLVHIAAGGPDLGMGVQAPDVGGKIVPDVLGQRVGLAVPERVGRLDHPQVLARIGERPAVDDPNLMSSGGDSGRLRRRRLQRDSPADVVAGERGRRGFGHSDNWPAGCPWPSRLGCPERADHGAVPIAGTLHAASGGRKGLGRYPNGESRMKGRVVGA